MSSLFVTGGGDFVTRGGLFVTHGGQFVTRGGSRISENARNVDKNLAESVFFDPREIPNKYLISTQRVLNEYSGFYPDGYPPLSICICVMEQWGFFSNRDYMKKKVPVLPGDNFSNKHEGKIRRYMYRWFP